MTNQQIIERATNIQNQTDLREFDDFCIESVKSLAENSNLINFKRTITTNELKNIGSTPILILPNVVGKTFYVQSCYIVSKLTTAYTIGSDVLSLTQNGQNLGMSEVNGLKTTTPNITIFNFSCSTYDPGFGVISVIGNTFPINSTVSLTTYNGLNFSTGTQSVDLYISYIEIDLS
ncbi:MAG: hypothetical protein ACK5B9_03655 [Flavobacteriia bacterium]|jgi:hypothetical protein